MTQRSIRSSFMKNFTYVGSRHHQPLSDNVVKGEGTHPTIVTCPVSAGNLPMIGGNFQTAPHLHKQLNLHKYPYALFSSILNSVYSSNLFIVAFPT